VSPQLYSVLFLFGSLALALWTRARFPHLTPAGLRGALCHVGVTMIAGQLLTPLALHLLTGSMSVVLVGVFAVALPALVYTLLAAVWLLQLLSEHLRGSLR
jgi:hypothetical protein